LLPDFFEVRQAEGGELLRAEVLRVGLEHLDHLKKNIFVDFFRFVCLCKIKIEE
jgi:hypothetical protein